MTTPEMPRGEEYAQRLELELLHNSTRDWLLGLGNGQYREERHFGTQQSIPIAEGPDEYSVHISGDALRLLLPDISQRLEIGEGIDIQYETEHYSRAVDGGYAYVAPQTVYSINKASTAVVGNETIFLEVTPDGEPSTTRLRESHEGGPLGFNTGEGAQADLERVLRAGELEEDMGLARLTQAEYADLQTIVNNLDRLVR